MNETKKETNNQNRLDEGCGPFDITELDLNEVYFTELESGTGREYAFRLLNWQAPASKQVGGITYWVFQAISLQEYTQNQLYDGQLFRLHLPHLSFKHALIKFLAYHRIGSRLKEFRTMHDVVADVVLYRSNRKVICVTAAKFCKVRGAGDEEVLFQAQTAEEVTRAPPLKKEKMGGPL